jgi:hypothetical protein
MTAASISIFITYGQMAVFDSASDHQFHNWTTPHFEQGFSWRPGSVCFRLLEEGGQYNVDVIVSELVSISPDAIRVIQTPFEVQASTSTEIGSMTESVPIFVPSGIYNLRIECFPIPDGADGGRVRFVFTKTSSPAFKILRADAAITISEHLVTTDTPF